MKKDKIKYALLKVSDEEIYILSDQYCKDGDFYYDTRYGTIHHWSDRVEQHGVKGLGWEGKIIWKIESATVNYTQANSSSGKEWKSNWERAEIILFKFK